ncbi:MAG: universal stress protein [Archaeoglobaceae archaeon]
MFEKVLYPIDLTDVSITCARGLVELRKYGMKELTLFHVIEYDPAALIEGGIDVDKFVANLKEKAKKKLENLVEEFSKDLLVKVEVAATVDPSAEIAKIGNGFDLLVIPSKSKSQLFLGKTAEEVVRSSTIPCLVIKSRLDAGRSYYEFVFRNLFERPVFIVDKTSIDFIKTIEKLRDIGFVKVTLVRIAELDEALEGKVSKEEIMHPLTPIPRITEVLSDYWKSEKRELEKIRSYLATKGISAEIVVSFGSLERNLEKISKLEGLSLAICSKQNFDKALKVADAVLVLG